MKPIAVFINSEGLASSPKEAGSIRVYVLDESTSTWRIKDEFIFSMAGCTSISETRKLISNMIQKLGNCRIFAAGKVIGQLYSVLEANGFNIYEVEGMPEQALDSILSSEENGETVILPTEGFKPSTPIQPVETDVPGRYLIDLKAALDKDCGLTSKKILLPFLARKNFNELEVLCDHVPRWFDDEFAKQGLLSNISKLEGNIYKVIITAK